MYNRCEKKVSQRLQQLGFTTLVPTQVQRKRWSDRWKKQEVILFKNYVFVETTKNNKNQVFQAGNIYKYVQFEGKPAVVSAQEISIIKNIGNASHPVDISYESYRAGDEVTITTGCLSGQRAIVTKCNGSNTLMLHLPNLHCFAKVELTDVEVRKVCVLN